METREGYKKTKLGWMPEDWKVLPLLDTADKNDRHSFTGGPFGSDLKSEHYTNDGVRIIQLQNIGDGVFHNNSCVYTTLEKADSLRACNIYAGDIIIAKMAEPLARATKIPKIHDRYLMCSDGIRLKVNEEQFDIDYILYSINSRYFRINAEANGTGTTRLRIGLKTLRNLELFIPPLPEQQKIASILSTVDEKIQSIEEQIDQTEQLKKGLMNKLLTEGIGHTEFKDTKIGRIPKSWDVKKFDKIISVVHGQVDPKEEPFNNMPHIGSANIEKGTGKLLEYRTAEEEGQISGKYLFNENHILYSKIRPNFRKVAYPRFRGLCSADTYPLEADHKYLIPIFLKFLLLESRFSNYAVSVSMRTGMPKINRNELSPFNFSLPPLPEQEKIAIILSKIDDKTDILQTKKSAYETLKKGLMAQLLTGQMRVKI